MKSHKNKIILLFKEVMFSIKIELSKDVGKQGFFKILHHILIHLIIQ